MLQTSPKSIKKKHSIRFWCFWGMLLVFQVQVVGQSSTFMQSEYKRINEMLPEDLGKAKREIVRYHDQGIKLNNDEFVAKAHYLFALYHYYQSRYYISNRFYAAALKSTYSKEDLNFKETCLNNMGVNYEMQNLLPESLNAYHQSLKTAEKIKDSVSIEQSFVNIGLLNAKSKNYQQANFLTYRSLQFFTRSLSNLQD